MTPGAAAEPARAELPAAERRWEPWVFAGLAALHLVPIWLLAYVPSQDGPAHLENAVALLRRTQVPVLAEYYELLSNTLIDLYELDGATAFARIEGGWSVCGKFL